MIVSALKGETDTLLAQADANGGDAFPHITARLARLGEFRSAALMGLALSRLGLRAKVLDPHEIGLMAEGDPMDSNLSELDKDAMAAALEEADAVVLPGFTACHADHGAATLGRGGTDLTAVFFRCEGRRKPGAADQGCGRRLHRRSGQRPSRPAL